MGIVIACVIIAVIAEGDCTHRRLLGEIHCLILEIVELYVAVVAAGQHYSENSYSEKIFFHESILF